MTKETTKPAPPARRPRQSKPKGEGKKAPIVDEIQKEVEQQVEMEISVEKEKEMASVKSPEKSIPEILSPVSKLEQAREAAAQQQQERIALASAKHVEEARRKSLKRKEIESDIVMPEKVPKLHTEEEEEDQTVHVIESTTVMHTTSTLTQRRPLKKIEQNEGESATAYALRAAKIRKDERKHHDVVHHEEQPEVENQPPTAYEKKQKGVEPVENIYKPPVEFVNNLVRDSITRGAGKDIEVVQEAEAADNFTRFYVHLAVLLVVVFTVLLGMTEFYVSQLPYCDSSIDNGFNCKVCPDNGICSNGVLESCKEPFVALDDTCVHATSVKRDSTQLVSMISTLKNQAADKNFCKESFFTRVSQIDWTMPIQTSNISPVTLNTDSIEKLIRSDAIWNGVGVRTYGIIFKKALQKLNVTSELIPVTMDDASLSCQATNYLIEYFTIFVSGLFLSFGIVLVYSDQRQSEEDAELLHKMYCLVQDELIVQAGKEEKKYVSDYLKNHVLDVLKLTKPQKSRVETILWTRLTKLVAKENRIRITEVADGSITWEWIEIEPIVGTVPVQVA